MEDISMIELSSSEGIRFLCECQVASESGLGLECLQVENEDILSCRLLWGALLPPTPALREQVSH
jgi:hypothetical protein